jgi:hypothetical protein
MSDKLSMSDILSRLLERVRRIENDAGQVAGVLDKMLSRISEQKAAAEKKKPA